MPTNRNPQDSNRNNGNQDSGKTPMQGSSQGNQTRASQEHGRSDKEKDKDAHGRNR